MRLHKCTVHTGSNLDSTFKCMVTGRFFSAFGAAVASADTFRARHLVKVSVKGMGGLQVEVDECIHSNDGRS